MRGKRISQWLIAILVATLFLWGESFFNWLLEEKPPITVCAPEDMKSAFENALSYSDLAFEYEIVMTDDKDGADIIVDYGKENDASYKKLAFSPFVIAYNPHDSCFKALKKAETVVPSEYNNSFYEINFLKVINEVIEQGQWENLGITDHGQIHLFYPDKTTPYWHDFYNFMLLVVNNGKYPKTELEMTRAIQMIERFEKSECTEAVVSFDEKIERTDGFAENSIYVIPEKTVYDLASDHSTKVRLFFPFVTTNFNYYVQGVSENGINVVNNMTKKSYSKLEYYEYRNEYFYELGNEYNAVYDERDVYQVVEIPQSNFFTGDYSSEE